MSWGDLMLTDGFCFVFFKMSHLGCGHYFFDIDKTSTKMSLCEFLSLPIVLCLRCKRCLDWQGFLFVFAFLCYTCQLFLHEDGRHWDDVNVSWLPSRGRPQEWQKGLKQNRPGKDKKQLIYLYLRSFPSSFSQLFYWLYILKCFLN